MKRVKAINRLVIYQVTESERHYNAEDPESNHTVYNPDGRIVLDRVTYEVAESYCRNTTTFTKRRGRPSLKAQ